MSKTPLDMIAARIETHRREIARLNSEIERLTIAGEVMADLAGMAPPQAAQKLLGPPVQHNAGFTIRRLVGDETAAPATTTRKKRGYLRAMILAALDGEPLRSGEIAVKLFGAGDERGRKLVWQTLHVLKNGGYVNRDDAGRYSRTHAAAPTVKNGAAMTVN